jgi:hypothetical protein
MTRPAAVAFIASIVVGPAFAGEAAHIAALDQLQAKFSACVAFYTLTLSCAENGDARRRLTSATKRSEALAAAIPMNGDDVALRLQLHLTAQQTLMGGDCRDAATLEDRYAPVCDPLSTAPE